MHQSLWDDCYSSLASDMLLIPSESLVAIMGSLPSGKTSATSATRSHVKDQVQSCHTELSSHARECLTESSSEGSR